MKALGGWWIGLWLLGAAPLWAQPVVSPEQIAAGYFEAEDYTKALVEYEALFEKRPEPLFFERIWICQMKLNAFREAEKTVRKRLKEPGQKTLPNRIKLGQSLEAQKKTKEADAVYGELIAEIDAQPSMVYALAKAFEDARLYRRAIETYQRAEQNNPGFQFQYQKAQLYAELGDIEAVYDEFMELLALNPAYLPNIQALLAQSIGTDPQEPANVQLKQRLLEQMQKTDNAIYNDLLVWVFMQEGDFDGAFRQLRALDQRYDRGQFEVFELGKSAQRLKAYSTALDCFDYIANEVKPESNWAPKARLETLETRRLMLLDQLEPADWAGLAQAYADLIAVQGLGPETAEAARRRSEILGFRLGDTTRALDELEAVLDLPGRFNSEAWLSYGDLLAFAGSSAPALLAYARVEQNAEQIEHADQAKFNRALLAFRQAEFDWAVHLFDALKTSTSKAISNDAIDYSVLIRSNTDLDSSTEALRLYAWADAYFFRRMPDEALKTLDQLNFAFPEHTLSDEALWLRARIYADQGQLETAGRCLEDLLAADPESVWADDALLRLGQWALRDPAKKERAQRYFTTLLEAHPDSFHTEEARRSLRKLRGKEVL